MYVTWRVRIAAGGKFSQCFDFYRFGAEAWELKSGRQEWIAPHDQKAAPAGFNIDYPLPSCSTLASTIYVTVRAVLGILNHSGAELDDAGWLKLMILPTVTGEWADIIAVALSLSGEMGYRSISLSDSDEDTQAPQAENAE